MRDTAAHLLPAILLALTLVPCAAAPATAQPAPAFHVQLHVSGDRPTRDAALEALTGAERAIRDVQIVERDGEYVVSLLVLRTAGDTFVASMVVMNAHTQPALAALGARWQLDVTQQERLVSMFKGSGALMDQRILTGADLAALCRDAIAALDTELLQPLRRRG
jgi:hypothetical protein